MRYTALRFEPDENRIRYEISDVSKADEAAGGAHDADDQSHGHSAASIAVAHRCDTGRDHKLPKRTSDQLQAGGWFQTARKRCLPPRQQQSPVTGGKEVYWTIAARVRQLGVVVSDLGQNRILVVRRGKTQGTVPRGVASTCHSAAANLARISTLARHRALKLSRTSGPKAGSQPNGIFDLVWRSLGFSRRTGRGLAPARRVVLDVPSRSECRSGRHETVTLASAINDVEGPGHRRLRGASSLGRWFGEQRRIGDCEGHQRA